MSATGTSIAQTPVSERIEFASFTPVTMFDVARERRENWPMQKVWGDLTLPARAENKYPVMLLMHGSGGIEAGMQSWVEAFNSIGVATFVVNSFEPRGVKRTAENQALVPPAATLLDAFKALEVLAEHSKIDARRIGIMGFSRGGTVAFQTAVEPLRRAANQSAHKFALHIPTYAGCNQVYWSTEITRAPILNLVGERDDYTGAGACEQLTKRYAAAGAPVRSIQYANAHHAWDATYKVLYLSGATSGAACGVVRWDIESWTITAENSGQTIEPKNLDAFFRACIKRGVSAGRNDSAATQSRQDVLNFVSEQFLKN